VVDTSKSDVRARFEHFLRSMIGRRYDDAKELLAEDSSSPGSSRGFSSRCGR
jgi:hypothetical protein